MIKERVETWQLLHSEPKNFTSLQKKKNFWSSFLSSCSCKETLNGIFFTKPWHTTLNIKKILISISIFFGKIFIISPAESKMNNPHNFLYIKKIIAWILQLSSMFISNININVRCEFSFLIKAILASQTVVF